LVVQVFLQEAHRWDKARTLRRDRTMPPSTYVPPPSTRIVVAATPAMRARLERVLEGHQLTFAQTTADVMSFLSNDKYGMVIISVHFDESQMFTLLADIRAHSKYRKVPIVCVLADRGKLSDIGVEGLDHAVKAMTANGFLDLQRFSDDDAGNARIRRIVDYLILIDGDLQAISEVQDLGRATERRRGAR
jgi:CheY-like chemotaxis protein